MPRVFLTQEQRTTARHQEYRRKIADAIAAYKNNNHCTNEEFGKSLGVGHEMVAKWLDKEETRATGYAVFTLLELAGLIGKGAER